MVNQNPSSPQVKKRPTWWHNMDVPRLNANSIVEAKVLKKTPRSLYLDLGPYGTGLIWGAEFARSAKNIENLKEGDVVRVKVLEPENEFGMVDVSLQDTFQESQYQWVKDLINNNQTIVGKVVGANRGGLLIKINDLQGFLPTSQMTEKHFPRVEGGDKEKILEALEGLIGQDIEVKVINFNPALGKIILSEKKIEEDAIKDIVDKLKVGDELEGTLNKITSGGAIITVKDYPQLKAFLPLEEASWTPVDNLEDILKPNQTYRFQIASINKNKEIILSLRSLEEDPVIQKLKQYQPQQVVRGKIYKFIPFGALVQIDNDVFGFIHSSEFGGVEAMQQKISLNQELDFVIDTINLNEKRINLHLKEAL
ncbi:MAG TPA: S1 RNA-binding domain-containing protein [Candidatus Paceibacterota bacterium]|nr:S1 RNA-binding domain-containing protein [Candidatus Paceibacterota bacterium]HOL53759.1 S1 RNA-binding domain-containing protein [Candidatus Paceibacterota bacterium]HON21694.1 S1 RNA-binding domain-containing protein [Candidatus Paceibacterota bacterium]HOV88488.1 S1 RNA-binding domain-containing protein [Candidatus Paceibacterota bacterium]HPP16841.1 S1 RNA-binding domain-containing protein [Candidatus Paceibacterota bacterium]